VSTPPPRKAATFDWTTAFIAVLVLVSGTTVYLRDGWGRVLEILGHDFLLFVGIMPSLLAGCLLAAFVALLLPRETVRRWIGAESGITGIFIGAAAGVILPGGPFTIYPVAATLAVMGADIGAIVAFITSWSLLGYSRALVWELPFFGVHFVGWRILLSLPLPILAGLMVRPLANLLAKKFR
jgi:uncharacterized membrane protein YraQ (UPF0718 family)